METQFDIKEIQEKFNRIVKYSQDLDGEVNSDELFENWRKNKSFFIQNWGGRLIKELGEQSFHLSEEQRAKAVSNVIDQIEYLYRESGLGYPDFRLDDLISFILENQENFFDNEVREAWNNGSIEVPKGMKILRAFKYFCTDKDLLNDIQSVASMAIQNDKITGTLCLSVHPLDYLSISENAHNWRSCHALDGEYRAGNLNYMGDSCTIICYLKSSHKAELPRFPEDIKWNSKKWRMLLFFDEDFNIMMAGRQYPFFENSLLLPIKHAIEEDFHTKFSGWFDYYHTHDQLKSFIDDENESHQYEVGYNVPYIPVGGRLLKLRKLVQDNPGTLQFNDLLESSTYTQPYYSFRLHRSWEGTYYHTPQRSSSIPKIRVGLKCTCLECGKEDITMSESFLCKHCMIKEGQTEDSDEFGSCHWCGQTFLWDEGTYIEDQFGISQATCPDCLQTEVMPCKECGVLYHKAALNDDGLCQTCANSRFKIEEEPISVSFRDKVDGSLVLSWDLSSENDNSVFTQLRF